MAATVIPMPKFMAFSDAGAPLSAGLVYTYAAGTTTPLATYSDSDLTTPNANPVVLDSAGRATIYLTASSYKIVLKNSAGATVYTQDNIIAAAPYNVDLDVPIVAGEALTAGQAIYLSDGTGSRTAGRWYLTDSDTAAYSTTVITGFVTTALALGEEGSVRLLGQATVPGPLSVGLTYYLSGTPGAIGTTAGTFVKNMGMADSTTTLIMTVATPVTPGGSNTQVQFNDSGVLGGDSGFTYIKATDAVAIAGPTTVGGTLGVTGLITSTAGISGGPATHTTGSFSSTVATGALTVTGAATVSTTLGVTGATTLSSTLGVTGLITSTGGITGGASSHTTGAFSSTVTGGTYNGQTISSAANFTGSLGVAGLLTVSGFGTHTFSAGGTGANLFNVRNTTAGTGNSGAVSVGNDTIANLIVMQAYSSTFTPSGPALASGGLVNAQGVGGLSIQAEHASGAIRFYSGGTTERLRLNTSGALESQVGLFVTASMGGANVTVANTVGFYMATWPTTGSAANAYVADGGYVSRSTSSRRWKHDEQPLDVSSTLASLSAFQPVTYRGLQDKDQRRHVGLIAEDVAPIAPLLATYDEGGETGTPNYVTYDRIPAYLIVGWQQHDTIISQLAARIAALESQDN